MSHRVRVKDSVRKVLRIPVFRHLKSLQEACRKLGLAQPEFVHQYRMGMVDKQSKAEGQRGDVLCTGWAVQLKGKSGDRDWTKKLVFGKLSSECPTGEQFDLRDADEEPFFDNWPLYDESHVEVRATIGWIEAELERRAKSPTSQDLTWEEVVEGMKAEGKTARRPGEGGRWGELKYFDELCTEYKRAANKNLMEDLMADCALNNEAVEQIKVEEDEIILRVLS